jgi:hypothetical protein
MAKKNSTPEDFKKEVYIRNISEEDNLMLRQLREVTGIKTNTQALLYAGYNYIKFKELSEELQRKLNRANRQLESIKYNYNRIGEHEKQLKNLINEEIDDN